MITMITSKMQNRYCRSTR